MPQSELVTLELDLPSVIHQADLGSILELPTIRGIRFFSLESAGDNPDTRRNLYALVREGVIDDPSNATSGFMDFAQFSEQLFEQFYWRWADCQFLASKGTDWIGLTNLQLREEGNAEFGVTVVKRAFRRRGIARALKCLALQHAYSLGIRHVLTRNDEGNTAILSLNRSLGFKES